MYMEYSNQRPHFKESRLINEYILNLSLLIDKDIAP